MKLIYPACFYPCEEGGYTVVFPDLPGCVTEGDTLSEAVDMAIDAASGWLLNAVEKNEPIISPNPSKNKAFYSFKLHQTEFVQISLLNNTGDTIAVLKNKILGAGKYIEEIDATKLGLVNGIYYIKKVLGKEIQTTKLVIESDR